MSSAGLLAALASILAFAPSVHEKLVSLAILQKFSELEIYKNELHKTGGLFALINCLSLTLDPKINEEAAIIICNICDSEPNKIAILQENSFIALIKVSLASENPKVKQLFFPSLNHFAKEPEGLTQIGQSGALDAVLEALTSKNPLLFAASLKSLLGLVNYPQFKPTIAKARATLSEIGKTKSHEASGMAANKILSLI
eukprot:TRINITY_DN5755_c0_g1_i1.p1 TRINITY_DN5755_c0_g1~~TRINITY_DN5755_c0_g1_i1.p1  ORF type:complete len:199 (+),score=35.80 TRINITY_DN5755_c0_g1_i1:141-737(+)